MNAALNIVVNNKRPLLTKINEDLAGQLVEKLDEDEEDNEEDKVF